MFESSLYLKSPICVQETFLSARAYARRLLREGAAFRRELDDVTRTQWLGGEALAGLQRERLGNVIDHAVPHRSVLPPTRH